jgi:hypothetical protein
MYRHRSIILPVVTALCGVLLAISMIGIGEVFFRINSRFHWLKYREETLPPATWAEGHSPAWEGLNLNYLDGLTAQKTVVDNQIEGYPDYQNSQTLDQCDGDSLFSEPGWWMFRHPGCVIKESLRLRRSGRLIYSVSYRSDERALRVVPGTNHHSARPLIFMGASTTFGQGVEDDETFASRIAVQAPDFRTFNFGMSGFSPNQYLHMLRLRDVRTSGDFGAGGLVIYTHSGDPVNRVVGTMNWIADDNRGRSPYFVRSGNDIVEKGTFDTGRPFLSRLYHWLYRSELLKFFAVDLPVVTSDDVEFYVQIVDEIRRESLVRLGVDKFLFVIFPGETNFHSSLLEALRKYHIDFIDYSGVDAVKLMKGHNSFPGEGHPTALMHRFYADLLLRDLQLKGYLSVGK